jgi:hypothetical protein
MEMKIFKTWVHLYGDEKAGMCQVDTISYQGKLWLVPSWIDNRVAGLTMPARIICLDALPYERDPGAGCDFVLNESIPTAVFYGQIPPPPDSPYLVIESPDVRIPSPGHYPFKPST